MALAEFDLIQRFFACYPPRRLQNRLGIGDDCALLSVPDGYELAVTTDIMVEGVHFFANVQPYALGHKLLAVNLSDLASMGAEPLAVTLGLTLPRIDQSWLQAFSEGFIALAKRFGVDLIGGDTTAGPLTLSVQAMGLVPKGRAMLRSAAKVGDAIFLTGPIGDAGLGLKIRQGYHSLHAETPLQRFDLPMPRVEQGLAIRDRAHACIDISDGLAADLGHILQRSGVGACLDWQALPLSEAVHCYIEQTADWQLPLIAGDDYELCFTAPADLEQALLPTGCHRIGFIEAEPGLRLDRAGRIETFQGKGYEHFA